MIFGPTMITFCLRVLSATPIVPTEPNALPTDPNSLRSTFSSDGTNQHYQYLTSDVMADHINSTADSKSQGTVSINETNETTTSGSFLMVSIVSNLSPYILISILIVVFLVITLLTLRVYFVRKRTKSKTNQPTQQPPTVKQVEQIAVEQDKKPAALKSKRSEEKSEKSTKLKSTFLQAVDSVHRLKGEKIDKNKKDEQSQSSNKVSKLEGKDTDNTSYEMIQTGVVLQLPPRAISKRISTVSRTMHSLKSIPSQSEVHSVSEVDGVELGYKEPPAITHKEHHSDEEDPISKIAQSIMKRKCFEMASRKLKNIETRLTSRRLSMSTRSRRKSNLKQ